MRGTNRSVRKQYLKEYADSLPELGRFTMDVQAQLGTEGEENAEFILCDCEVLVCRPHAKHGHHGDDPLPLYVVQITEANPPAGEKAISWTLLTNEPVQTFEDAWQVARWYERRLDHRRRYHKAKKSGYQIRTCSSRLPIVWSQLLPCCRWWR